MITRRGLGLGVLGGATLLALGVPVAWRTVDERRFLDALVDAIFPATGTLPSPAAVDVTGSVQRYLAHLPASVAWQARGLFRGVELGTLPTHGARFSALDRAARVEVLEAMERSALAPRRLMLHALRQMAAMGYWQHASTWAHLGYDGPWVER